MIAELTGELSYLSWQELLLRVGMAMLFGLILGLERDTKNKPIDFRAYMIVAVTTCILAILGQEIYADFSLADSILRIDLANIIAGVMTGIGFLGAGAIIQRDGSRVVGTATGASIWAAGGIGLAIGFGFYSLGIVAFIAIGIILLAGGIIRARFSGIEDKETQKQVYKE
ncbi:MgtC/SapB family protein [Sneathiella sp.]|uniref:MgtC/SapB family protein n=1 Tax=Sneathiella sp. TaxID=1964365 RepID=UPI00260E5A1D|nr:MgtC/SapB family protein [Sneathiella sp.]MDF2368225.1 MgtC/SapB family protein [Sneathiella sp.]